MIIVFRVDGGTSIGSGHIVRCLTLASELRRQVKRIIFITRKLPGNLIQKIADEGYGVFCLPQSVGAASIVNAENHLWSGVRQNQDALSTIKIIEKSKVDWVIVDHYGLDSVWEKRLRSYTKKILVIDDLANRSHDCDILLDQNYYGSNTQKRYANLVLESTTCLLGPNFSLLKSRYRELKPFLTEHNGEVRRILIFFGSADPYNYTEKILKILSLNELQYLHLDIVLGENYPNGEKFINLAKVRGNVNVYRWVPCLAELMVAADLMIGAGGTTSWERLCLGLPGVVIPIAKNQYEVTKILNLEGYQFSLKNHKKGSIRELAGSLNKLIFDKEKIIATSRNGKKLVDGLGAFRVIRVIMGKANLGLCLRSIDENDEGLLLEWANDQSVRSNSFSAKTISKKEHSAWFRAKLVDKNCRIYIAEDRNKIPMGQIRFDFDSFSSQVEIDFSVDKYFRGFGVGKFLVKKGIEEIMKHQKNVCFVAKVGVENIASQKCFTSLLFSFVNQVITKKMNYIHYELRI